MSEEQELIPIEQHTLTFYGKPIIVVRLHDGRPGVVLRFLCENLHIDTNAQVQRVQRSEAMAEDLVFTRVETPGGVQRTKTIRAAWPSFSTSGKPWMSSIVGRQRHR